MAGNRRGKLKEELEGIHRNYDWIKVHCQKCVIMLEDDNPGLTGFFVSLAVQADEVDKATQEIYSRI